MASNRTNYPKTETEHELETNGTNGHENRSTLGKDCEQSLRGIAVDLKKLNLMLKEEINRKAVKIEKYPSDFEQLASRLEIFFLVFFFLANAMVTIIFLAVGYGRITKV